MSVVPGWDGVNDAAADGKTIGLGGEDGGEDELLMVGVEDDSSGEVACVGEKTAVRGLEVALDLYNGPNELSICR